MDDPIGFVVRVRFRVRHGCWQGPVKDPRLTHENQPGAGKIMREGTKRMIVAAHLEFDTHASKNGRDIVIVLAWNVQFVVAQTRIELGADCINVLNSQEAV